MPSARISHNADGTITVKVGRMVEHIDPTGKDKGQVFDAVKTAAFSKGAKVSDVTITEILFNRVEEARRR